MAVIPLSTGDTLFLDTKNLPKDISEFKNHIFNNELSINDLFTIINIYNAHNTENMYHNEILDLLQCAEEVSEFDYCSDVAKMYSLTYYVQYANLYKVKKKDFDMERCTNLYNNLFNDSYSNYDFENMRNELDIILNDFNTSVRKNNMDHDEYTRIIKKISEYLKKEITHPYFDAVKGFYYLLVNNVENAMNIFENDKTDLSFIGKKICQAIDNKFVITCENDYDAIINAYLFKKRGEDNEYVKKIENKNMRVNILCENDQYESLENRLNEVEMITEIYRKLYVHYKEIDKKNIFADSMNSFVKDLNYLIKFYGVESFSGEINYYLGKIYHIKRDYKEALEYYSKSNTKRSIYNIMQITKKSLSNDDFYRNINNYIFLANGEYEKIIADINLNYYDIYKAKLSEGWCGNAILKYTKLLGNEDISQRIVINNLSYFYYKCLQENENDIIEQFYNLIKDVKPKIYKKEDSEFIYDAKNIKRNILSDESKDTNITSELNNLSKDMNNSKETSISKKERNIHYCNKFIAMQLYQYDDIISKYNLSFYTLKEESIRLLNNVIEEDAYKTFEHTIRLGVLLNSLDTFNDLLPINDMAAMTLIGHYHYKQGNIKLAVNAFQTVIEKNKENNDYLLFSYFMLGKINMKKYKQKKEKEILKKSLVFYESGLGIFKNCFYLAFGLANVFYEKRDFIGTIKVCKEILKDVERDNDYMIRRFKKSVAGLLGLALCKNGNVNEGIDIFKKNKIYDILKKIENNEDKKNDENFYG